MSRFVSRSAMADIDPWMGSSQPQQWNKFMFSVRGSSRTKIIYLNNTIIIILTTTHVVTNDLNIKINIDDQYQFVVVENQTCGFKGQFNIHSVT